MTNHQMLHTSRAALLALCFAAGCFGNDNTGAAGSASSSGSHLLACSDDGDCAAQGAGATCSAEGVCIDAAGEPIVVSSGGSGGTGAAGAGAAGPGTVGGSGAGTGAGGASGECNGQIPALCRVCADGSCGEAVCKGGSYEFVCPEDGTGGTSGGGSVGSGTGTVLPDCNGVSDGQGAMCSGLDTELPECCEGGGTHLQCQYEVCTASFPGSCTGTWEPVMGSTACGGSGGYEPCANMNCGDACTICDPSDNTCLETQEVKVCTGTGGDCVGSAVDCTPPESCDPAGVNTCGDGMTCCAEFRCGPVSTDNGLCEAADPSTGGCMPCACEMQPGGCPICNSPDTLILTPDGEREIAELREGDLVLSVHQGAVIAVPVLRTRNVEVFNHAVVRLMLDNGARIEVSGSHPTADGLRLDSLMPGDALGDVRVLSVEMVPYTHDRTYDILPASDTGTYFAGGALLGSTLMVPGVF